MFVTTRMQKTKDIVHVPIGAEALELIGYSPDKKGLVFPNVSCHLKGTTLKNWLQSAGITKHITFHCARHTWATLQLYSGTHLKIVQECLGHKNVTTTEIYAKTVDEQKKAVVDRIRLK